MYIIEFQIQKNIIIRKKNIIKHIKELEVKVKNTKKNIRVVNGHKNINQVSIVINQKDFHKNNIVNIVVQTNIKYYFLKGGGNTYIYI